MRTVGARNVVDAARAAGTRRVVAQSYAHVYAPESGWVKEESERLNLGSHVPEDRRRNVEAVVALEDAVCETPGIEGVALRYGSLYGPCTAFDWDGSLAELVRARHYPIVGGGTGWSSFVHVDDAAQAAVLALDGPAGRFNISDDEPAPRERLAARATRRSCARRSRGTSRPSRRGPCSASASPSARPSSARPTTAGRARSWASTPRYRSWRHGFRAEFELELERAA